MGKVCVMCGRETGSTDQVYYESLYQKTGIIKLLECENCGSLVDRYVEQEGTLILLDLALQSKPAFRHCLLNQEKKFSTLIWKMVLTTLIVDAYCRWRNEAGDESFFDREHEYYIKLFEAFVSLVVYIFGIILPFAAYCHLTTRGSMSKMAGKHQNRSTTNPRESFGGHSNAYKWKSLLSGLLLAYCSLFLELFCLLWSTPDTTFLWWFVELLFVLTSFTAFRVVTRQDAAKSLLFVSTAHLSRYICQIPQAG